jgi:hypothetical protein
MTAALDTRHYLATTPRRLSDDFLVNGDLCDITVAGRYCLDHAASAAVDADGRTRILCAAHTALYFPQA